MTMSTVMICVFCGQGREEFLDLREVGERSDVESRGT